MRLRYKFLAVLALLGAIFIWGRHSVSPGLAPTPNVLPEGDTEQITINPNTHQLIILGPKGRTVETLPDRVSTFDIKADGTVKVTSQQFGFEHHLFIGGVGAEHLRLGVGMDVAYWKRLDLGIGIADQIGAYTPVAIAKVTYNIRGNLQVGITYQSNKYIGGILAVRVF